MSSPPPDDYKSLMSPWNPIDQSALKNIASVQKRIEVDHGTKVSNLVSIKHNQDQA